MLLLSVATNLEAGRRAELREGEAGPWQDPMDPDGAALKGDARQRDRRARRQRR